LDKNERQEVPRQYKKRWDENGEAILDAVEYAWESIQDIIDWVLDYITNIYEAWAALFRGDLGGNLVEKLNDAWDMVWNLIQRCC